MSAGDLVTILREPAPEDPDAVDPRGDAVPPSERATISDLVATWQVCLASGDIPGVLGLFTADGIRRLFEERSPVLGGPAGLRVAILSVSQVERLPDGRIAARVTLDPSGTGTASPQSLIAIAEQSEDGVWRIDHLHVPEESVGAAGMAESDSDAPPRALLRHPIAPGPGVPVPAPGLTVPMRGADVARTGIQFGPAPAREPVERWRTPTGWYSDAQPVVARGLVFFGGFSLGERVPLLEAVDAASGAVRWQTTAPVAWAEISDSPALGGDILFAPVQAPVAGVLAVAAATGEPLWFTPFGFTSVTAPAVDADAVYVAGWAIRNTWDRTQNDASGALFALDQRTGRERWRFLTPARFGPVSVGRTPSMCQVTAGSLPSTARQVASAGRRGSHPAPEIRRPSPVNSSSSPAPRSPPGGPAYSRSMPPAAPCAGASIYRALRERGPEARPPTASFSFHRGTHLKTTSAGGTPTLHAYDLANGQERWVFRANGPADAGQGVGADR